MLVCVYLLVNRTFPSLPVRPHGLTQNRGPVVLFFVPLSQLHVAMDGVAGSVNNYWSVKFSCGIINGLLFCHYGTFWHSKGCELAIIVRTDILYRG